jgi:hypothetical protein
MLQVTLGAGLRNPQGLAVQLNGDPVNELARILGERTGREAWWSGHTYRDDRRSAAAWLGSSCIHIDLDHHDADGKHVEMPAELASRLETGASAGAIPGNLLHLTPRGARVVFVLAELCTDRDAYRAAARAAAAAVRRAVAHLPALLLDDAVLLDLARLLYAPNATVSGVERHAAMVVMRPEPTAAATLQPPPTPEPARPPAIGDPSISTAIERYNADHLRDFPRNGGECPVCGHKGCFGQLPEDPAKWTCFSVGHSGAGRQGQGCWYGDALDLDAHAAGVQAIELLRRGGYLARRPEPSCAPPESDVASVTEPTPLTKSYASACRVLRDPELRTVVLGTSHPLEWNEMTRAAEWGRNALDDRMLGMIRERCELFLRDKKGRRLELSRENIECAALQVAHENAYHPVRDYLRRLRWDGVLRIESLAEDVLSLSPTDLQRSMLRKWLISAVARAMRPGCKVDSVLILVGPQGVGKSTFFSALAGPFFRDSMVDLASKDAYQVLHGSWIFEWAELETMARSKRAATVKAFVTSRVDSYRPAYARSAQDYPRSCVIVGSTNDDAFLEDPTGNRRFWIVPTDRPVDTDSLKGMRDQIWAEAVAAFAAGEPWWLTEQEERDLAPAQEEHVESDAWEDLVLRYAEAQAYVTMGGVLTAAVGKPKEQWDRRDQNRVAAILRRAGYHREKRRDASGVQFKAWRRPGTLLPTLDRAEK